MFTRRLRSRKRGRVSRHARWRCVTLPCIGFVSDLNYEILVISSVCVAFFASEDEVGGEAILGGFNGG